MLNEMMHRPVVMPELVNYMRTAQQGFPGGLGEIEQFANENGIPVIPHETAKFLDLFCASIEPRYILEIGTAIGFSASLMAQHLQTDGHLTTIDRYPQMVERAQENFKKLGLQDRITLLEGDAADILPTLSGSYDLIFMDSAKAKYIDFYPECMRLLRLGGILIIDDVFQGGTILEEESARPKRVRKIHRQLNLLLDTVLQDPQQRSCLVPLGDGLLMVRKEN
ncbi:O-methyltransferase [Fundicoccus culcitae]|uniref:tRNA 5-hydroxyuridine methyltransferase n=1 Tax=Fundicoccus culcitae TaxID=2969821 RepID=A0ABY5P3G2_9LACT|nr:O-methyltransferase [Fundicoccus culcitae]UUX33231.1 O-methyltransferase [Fundicoccus culcitae]